MNDNTGNRAILPVFVLLLLLLAFLNIGGKSFWATHAESRRAEVARNMVTTSDYLVPQVNGKPILTKPPLFFWAMAAVFKAGGEATEGLARVVPALSGLLCLWLTFLIGRELYDHNSALWASAILSTNYLYVFFMRFAELDMLFTLFITLSFYCLLRLWHDRGKKWSILFWLATALAFMVKGPFALLFPLLSFGLLLVVKREKGLAKNIFAWQGILLFLLLCAPWFIYVFYYSDAGAVFLEEVAKRVVDKRGQDRGLFYYLGSLGNFGPWVLLLPFAFWWAFKKEREKSLFPLLWLSAGFIMASLVSAKNHHYILPLYPAMALLTGRYICFHTGADEKFHRRLIGAVTLIVALLLAVLFCVLPFAHNFSGDVPPLDMLTSTLMATGGFALLVFVVTRLRCGQLKNALRAVVGGLLCTFIYVHAVITPALNSRNSHKDFLMQAKPLIAPSTVLRMYRIENFQVPFYLHKNAPVIKSAEAFERFNDETKSGYFLITESQFLDSALKISKGKVILRDKNYMPPRPSKEGERFMLIEVTKKGGLI